MRTKRRIAKKKTSSRRTRDTRRERGPSPYFDLPSFALPETDRIDVGTRFSLDRLVEFAHTALSRIDRYTFARFGFDDAWVQAMNTLLGDLSTLPASAEKARDADPSGEALEDVVAAAKAWRRDAMTIVAITPLLRDRVKRFATGTSVPKLVFAIRALLPLVAHPYAAACGGGQAMKGRGVATLVALKDARNLQRAALGRMTPEMRELCAMKGLLYEELRRLAKTAQLVAPIDANLFSVASSMRAHHRLTVPARASQPAGPTGTSHMS